MLLSGQSVLSTLLLCNQRTELATCGTTLSGRHLLLHIIITHAAASTQSPGNASVLAGADKVKRGVRTLSFCPSALGPDGASACRQEKDKDRGYKWHSSIYSATHPSSVLRHKRTRCASVAGRALRLCCTGKVNGAEVLQKNATAG